jgi:hypothetical protein
MRSLLTCSLLFALVCFGLGCTEEDDPPPLINPHQPDS